MPHWWRYNTLLPRVTVQSLFMQTITVAMIVRRQRSLAQGVKVPPLLRVARGKGDHEGKIRGDLADANLHCAQECATSIASGGATRRQWLYLNGKAPVRFGMGFCGVTPRALQLTKGANIILTCVSVIITGA